MPRTARSARAWRHFSGRRGLSRVPVPRLDVRDEHGDIVRQRMSTSFHLPFIVRSNTFYESGARAGHERVLLLCSTPVDEVTSLFTFVSWRNHDRDVPADRLSVEWRRRFAALLDG
jgi:hypothetical protein